MARNWEPGQPRHVRNVNPDLPATSGNQIRQGADEYGEPGYKSRHLGEILSTISMFDHGYLKIRRELDGYDVHLTWTWTITAAAGKYVYVRVPGSELLDGLTILARKILEVDDGHRQPTPDKRGPLRS